MEELLHRDGYVTLISYFVKTYQFKTHFWAIVIALKLQISFCQDSW